MFHRHFDEFFTAIVTASAKGRFAVGADEAAASAPARAGCSTAASFGS